jgi:hypothetical protein
MSLALIQESAKEIRRLAIAGSALAVGDFRLQKLIPPLEQAGAKVPVFAQVAKSIGDLVNGKEADSAANLLTVSTLLNAILYTQGQSSAEGELREIESFASNCSSTRTTARKLKPLVHALTSTGGGRFEIVKSAVEQGAFNDLRLIDPSVEALGDSFPELADLVAEKILPQYGPGIMPRLKAGLDLKGKKSDARRLQVMHRLDSVGTLPLCKTALEDGSPEVKTAAIACLGQHEECLPLVLEQVKAKNKVLRAAALEALAQHDRPEVTKLFTELIEGKSLDILAGPFRMVRNQQVLNCLLDQGKNLFELALKSGEEHISQFAEVLECLRGRKDAEVEKFLLASFAECEPLAKFKAPKKSAFVSYITGADLMDRMAWLLFEIGSPGALEAVLSKRDVLPATAFVHVLHSALRIWSSDKVYQEFSPLLKEEKGPAKEKSKILQHTIRTMCGGDVFESNDLIDDSSDPAHNTGKPIWDPRWLDAAIKVDESLLVFCLARPGHKGAINYLMKVADGKNRFHTGYAIAALARCQYPKLTDLFLDLVRKRAKIKGAFHHEMHILLDSARYLPVNDLPRLDAFAAELDEKWVDRFLEALAPLRR